MIRLYVILSCSLLFLLPSCVPSHPLCYGAVAEGMDGQKLALATDQAAVLEEQSPLRAEKSDLAVVYIGGFLSWVRGYSRLMYDVLPPICANTDLAKKYPNEARGFYYWEAGDGNLFSHDTKLIVNDIQAWRNVNPKSPLIIVGHSYGGSAAMDIARQLPSNQGGAIAIATLDPVSRRGSSKPRESAESVNYWVNAYIKRRFSILEIVPCFGGPWNHCPKANVNLSFSGREADFSRKHRHRHCFPLPMFVEREQADQASSTVEYLRQWLSSQPKK